ncbi:hypothetical protein [Leptospira alexanderi]|uniref:hypothetical protein n=1 Tax=Leptospira alexanderi TaxID=100053 RepID=UPI000990F2E9|nr:hypothetical protein [Leptospira alexanderi]
MSLNFKDLGTILNVFDEDGEKFLCITWDTRAKALIFWNIPNKDLKKTTTLAAMVVRVQNLGRVFFLNI